MPCGLKSFRCKDTNLFHFSRVPPPHVDELWIEIPKSKFVSLSRSWTAHRQGGIFGFQNNPNPEPVPSTQAYESNHVVFLECMMSLPVQGNLNQTSRPDDIHRLNSRSYLRNFDVTFGTEGNEYLYFRNVGRAEIFCLIITPL